jgi:hypothetical protein
MKKVIVALLLPLAPAASFAQTLKEFFSNTAITATWLGCDFTQAKVIGDPAPAASFIYDVYPGINGLFINEFQKYDIKGAFRRAAVDNDLTIVNKRNGDINKDMIVSTDSTDDNRLRFEDIKAMVKSMGYNSTGIGILFVVEAMDRIRQIEIVWVTLVDLKTSSVLLTERLEGETKGGMTTRNYWANGIKKVIIEIDKHKYEEWKKRN